jgi:hypothetical protein
MRTAIHLVSCAALECPREKLHRVRVEFRELLADDVPACKRASGNQATTQ